MIYIFKQKNKNLNFYLYIFLGKTYIYKCYIPFLEIQNYKQIFIKYKISKSIFKIYKFLPLHLKTFELINYLISYKSVAI